MSATLEYMSTKFTINLSNIDTILLDMDGTLLDLNYDIDFWRNRLPMAYANKHQLPFHIAKQKVTTDLEAQQGHLNWYCLDYWSEHFGLEITTLKKQTAHLIAIHPFVESFLIKAKQHNKKLYLVTNAHQKTLDLKLSLVPLAQYFDEIISSHELGFAKENPNFWQSLEQKIQFDKSKTIFFDDSEPVLKSAQQYGIAHIIAISKPSSKQAKKTINGLMNIENFSQLEDSWH